MPNNIKEIFEDIESQESFIPFDEWNELKEKIDSDPSILENRDTFQKYTEDIMNKLEENKDIFQKIVSLAYLDCRIYND